MVADPPRLTGAHVELAGYQLAWSSVVIRPAGYGKLLATIPLGKR